MTLITGSIISLQSQLVGSKPITVIVRQCDRNTMDTSRIINKISLN